MTCGFMAISFRTKGLAGDRADLHCRARLPSSLDTGPDALAPGVIAPARRTGMSHGRAFVPDGGASLPAIHDATAESRTVAAGAATIRGIDLADAWNDRDNTRYQNRPHVLPPSLVAQSTLHLAPAAADLLHHAILLRRRGQRRTARAVPGWDANWGGPVKNASA
jgi:hypothetical protein